MHRATVLVVDDDETCRQTCREALEAASFRVALASDGDSAVALAAEHPALRQGYDLALLDYVMPGRNGFAVFRELRRGQPDLSGILLTGHTSLSVAIEALNRGFSQVVAKPVEPKDLVDAVEAALAEREAVLSNARLRALTRLYDSLHRLASLSNPDELYDTIIGLALDETCANRVSLMLLDERQMLRVVASSGLAPDVVNDARRALGEPISGWVLQHGVVLEMAPDRPLPVAVRDALRRPEVTASVCLPLYAGGEPLGVLNVSRLNAEHSFHPGDVEIATILAADAALTIQRLMLMQTQVRDERVATVGRLASAIIHDLRAPVTIIGGAAEMLAETNPGAEAELAAIRRGVDELERTCRQLLSFARDPSGLMLDSIALPAFVDALVEPLAEACAERGVRLTRQVGEGRFEAARAELARALTDLLEAAVAAAPDGAELSLSARVENGFLEWWLRGPVRSTDGWQELDEPTALAAGGAGLTLAILRYIVERHRGQIQVELAESAMSVQVLLPVTQGR